MSTRSAIIEKLADGTYRGIYCHSDGYREGVGFTLRDHYTEPAKVSALIDLGDISFLEKECDPKGRPHSYGSPAKGVTVAYMRDRGEKECEPRTGATVKEVAGQIGHNGHVYVFNGEGWTHNGKKMPPAKAKKPARIVMLDADGDEIESIGADDDGFGDVREALEQAASS